LVKKHARTNFSINDLPEIVLHEIFSYCNLLQLGNLSQVSHKFNEVTASFLTQGSSIPVLFPCMVMAADNVKASFKFKINDDDEFKNYVVDSNVKAASNFFQLGIFFKKLSCLMPTVERISLCIKIMRRISPIDTTRPPTHMMPYCGAFFRKLTKGWADEEIVFAAELIYDSFNCDGHVSMIMSPEYILGSQPDVEMYVRSFLTSVFFKEVEFGQEKLWFSILLKKVSPSNNVEYVSRLLLLLSSPIKELSFNYGIQWSDHVEAIPATYQVAHSRYGTLILLLGVIIDKGEISIPDLLLKIFNFPMPWIPENIGSVLLLLGHRMSGAYLEHITVAVSQRGDSCINCFRDVTAAVLGMGLMTARFRWAFKPVYLKLEEVVSNIPFNNRENFFHALWQALGNEVTELRDAEGEEWATEGSMHLYKVIKLIGIKMTEKAFMHRPTLAGEKRESSMQVEE